MKEAYAIRTFNEQGRRYWVLYDTERTLRGTPRESLPALLVRWCYPNTPRPCLHQFRGVMRPSEMAMTIAEHRRKAKAAQP